MGFRHSKKWKTAPHFGKAQHIHHIKPLKTNYIKYRHDSDGLTGKTYIMSIKKQNIAIIGTVGLPASYGGFETLAEHLVGHLHARHELTVYCSGKKYAPQARTSHYRGARLIYLPLEANGIQSIPYDTLSILHALWYADVLLILGVAGAWILPFVRWFTNKKIIISIDGIEWKRDKWGRLAKMYLWWAEKMAVKYSHIDISDNESIQDYTALRYGSLSRIIEYGADHTQRLPLSVELKAKYPFLRKPYAFKVCRIEPENNLHTVLEAFAQMPGYPLVIIGNWANSDYGRRLRSRYEGLPNIHLLNPIYDQAMLDQIRGNAVLYVHGHSAGGTNPSLVEAMYLGLPVVAFNVSYNKTTTEGKAGYFGNAAELAEWVQQTDIATLQTLGQSMRSIAKRRYSWPLIAAKYEQLVLEATAEQPKSDIRPALSNMGASLAEQGLGHLAHQRMFFE